MHEILLPRSRLARVRNSARFPAQAALAARVPLAGRRVPMRRFWRHQPLGPSRRAESAISRVFGAPRALSKLCSALAQQTIGGAKALTHDRRLRRARSRAAERLADARTSAGTGLAHAASHTKELAAHAPAALARLPVSDLAGVGLRHVSHGEDGATDRHRSRGSSPTAASLVDPATGVVWQPVAAVAVQSLAPRARALGLVPVVLAAAGGAVAMYYLDPHQGRRRRALVRDKVARTRRLVTRQMPSRLERKARFVGGVARGIRHEATHLVGHNGAGVADDDLVVARVRSEVLRHANVKAGEIHIDAYEGCVTLRGQLSDEAEIRRLVSGTRRVDGVRAVRSYLHLPGEPPPNKAELYEHAAAHLPAI